MIYSGGELSTVDLIVDALYQWGFHLLEKRRLCTTRAIRH
jgi:hypothetical protein